MVEQQVEAEQPAHHVLRGGLPGVVVEPQGAEGFAVVADAVLHLVQAGVDVGVEVVLVLALVVQGHALLVGTVEVAGETVAFRGSVQVVQVRRDVGGADADVVLGQLAVEAADHRLAVAGEDDRAEAVWRGVGGAVAPHLDLRQVGVRLPGAFHYIDFVQGRVVAQLIVALVRLAATLAGSGIGLEAIRHHLDAIGAMQFADRVQRAHLVGKKFLPGRGSRAGDFRGVAILGLAVAFCEQQGQGAGSSGPFQEGAAVGAGEGLF
ncbi:hypothetical protein D9M68_491350 [compost metagenome]